MMARVQDNGETSEAFPVTRGGEQGYFLAPTRFSNMFLAMLSDAFRDTSNLTYRTGGSIFNIRIQQSKTKFPLATINDLFFADDCAFNNNLEPSMQETVDKFSNACDSFWSNY